MAETCQLWLLYPWLFTWNQCLRWCW